MNRNEKWEKKYTILGQHMIARALCKTNREGNTKNNVKARGRHDSLVGVRGLGEGRGKVH